MFKQEKGITLVALVVTIIVLLILAGVAISLTVSNTGILTQSKKAVDTYSNSANAESSELDTMTNWLNNEMPAEPTNT